VAVVLSAPPLNVGPAIPTKPKEDNMKFKYVFKIKIGISVLGE